MHKYKQYTRSLCFFVSLAFIFLFPNYLSDCIFSFSFRYRIFSDELL